MRIRINDPIKDKVHPKDLTFGDRIVLVRHHYGISISQMSDTIGVVKSNISRYERNLVQPTNSFFEKLIKYYRVNLNWLFGENQEMILPTKVRLKVNKKTTEALTPVSYTSFGIPIFGNVLENESFHMPISGAISAGEPLEVRSDGSQSIPFPLEKTAKDPDNYLVFRVNGLSMAPEIAHEDIVFIKRNNNWLELKNKIVAVMIRGEMTLKKLLFNESSREVVLKALNKDFDDIVIGYEMMEGVFLVGELKAIRRIHLNQKTMKKKS